MRSFTLIEIIIALGILGLLVSLTLPMGMNFYRIQQLESSSQEIMQTLRLAQQKAVFQERDSSFGVYFSPSAYILFQGASYGSRNTEYDESFNLPSVLSLSGLPEVVFSKMEGKPSSAGNIVLTSASGIRTININELGRVNLE